MTGWSACLGRACLPVDCPVEGELALLLGVCNGIMSVSVGLPLESARFLQKSSWVFSLRCAWLPGFLEAGWGKGAASLPLSIRVSIYSPYFQFCTPYSPSIVPDELTQNPHGHLKPPAGTSKVWWPHCPQGLCSHAVSTSPPLRTPCAALSSLSQQSARFSPRSPL